MVVVAIIAILSMIALPSYQEYILKGKRSDGKAFLLDLASRQERFYTQYSSYSPSIIKAAGCSEAACGLGLTSASSADKHYTATMTTTPDGCSPTGTKCTGFGLKASPAGWVDKRCADLTLTSTAQRGVSGGSSDANYCW